MITLVIIGVIAAMTVPTLINKTNNQEYVSKLKKAYSTLAQATNQIIAEEGPVTSWPTSTDQIYDLYKKKLVNAKECETNSGCFFYGTVKYQNNTTSSNWDSRNDIHNLILQDGIEVTFWSVKYSNLCNVNNYNDNGSNNVCLMITLNINGEKKPNKAGYDIFEFVLKKQGLYPAGCDIDGLCNTNHTGLACACKVLREGAINY